VRVAALYDIHGNLPALDAVLDEVERAGVDLIVAGGDLAWSPLPSPTVARLRELGDRCRYLMGNADRGAVADFDRDHSDDAPDAERSQRDFLAGLPPGFVVDVDGLGPTLFCHGSPHSDTQRITTATTDQRLRRILAGVDPRVVVCGHTHRGAEGRVLGAPRTRRRAAPDRLRPRRGVRVVARSGHAPRVLTAAQGEPARSRRPRRGGRVLRGPRPRVREQMTSGRRPPSAPVRSPRRRLRRRAAPGESSRSRSGRAPGSGRCSPAPGRARSRSSLLRAARSRSRSQ
jgi:predicted phosphodiesterase